MAISNIHETLLMYTKQKSKINAELSDVMFNMLQATKRNAEMQRDYNGKLQDAYYDPEYGYGTDEYMIIIENFEMEHEYELANLNSWESELEVRKNYLETRLNEITQFESSWQKLLQSNIKNDFSYGGGK